MKNYMETFFGVLAIVIFAGGLLPFIWLIIFQGAENKFSYIQIVIAMLVSPWLYKKGLRIGAMLAIAEPNNPMFSIKAIVRDVGILWSLAFINGLLLGLTSFKDSILVFTGLAAITTIIGFVISGLLSSSLAKICRLRHMVVVVLVFWFLTLPFNILAQNFNHIAWLMTLIGSSVYMLIGWRLSWLIAPQKKLLEA